MNAPELSDFILEWLSSRNGGELGGAVDMMTVGDYRRMREELTMILEHDGRPPNWVPLKPPDPSRS